jgi:hypothetical protein
LIKISRIGPLTALNKMALKNWGVASHKKITLFLWRDV